MALHEHGITSPFIDKIGPINDKNETANVSLQDGDPGYKKATPSPNTPSRTHRHTNLDGGANPQGTASQSPDAIKKRVG